jgi:Cdc6-like AAA superfamily ATPase
MITMTKEMISDEIKQQIADDLRNYVQTVAGGSMNKASKMLRKVSISYISQMLNEKWSAISDEAWRNVQKQVSVSYEGEWKVVEDTTNFKKLSHLFSDARTYALTFGIIGNAGWGKTETGKFDNANPNTFLIRCNEYHNRRSFMLDLLQQMGLEDTGYSVSAMMGTVINHLRRIDHPLIIMDEVDKLSDQVLYFFISMYNALEGECGFVLMGAPYLQKRIESGAKKNKKGYKEIFSRLGGKFIAVATPTNADMEKIIRANGIFDPLTIKEIINKSEADLRRVKRLVHAKKRKEVVA